MKKKFSLCSPIDRINAVDRRRELIVKNASESSAQRTAGRGIFHARRAQKEDINPAAINNLGDRERKR